MRDATKIVYKYFNSNLSYLSWRLIVFAWGNDTVFYNNLVPVLYTDKAFNQFHLNSSFTHKAGYFAYILISDYI